MTHYWRTGMKNEFGVYLDGNGYAPSIIQKNTSSHECYICSYVGDVARHEIIHGTANRRLSKKYGLWVNLCPICHRYVHEHPKSPENQFLYIKAENAALQDYGWTKTDFIRVFGKNFIEGD